MVAVVVGSPPGAVDGVCRLVAGAVVEPVVSSVESEGLQAAMTTTSATAMNPTVTRYEMSCLRVLHPTCSVRARRRCPGSAIRE
jgi:hypothetical protein